MFPSLFPTAGTALFNKINGLRACSRRSQGLRLAGDARACFACVRAYGDKCFRWEHGNTYSKSLECKQKAVPKSVPKAVPKVELGNRLGLASALCQPRAQGPSRRHELKTGG